MLTDNECRAAACPEGAKHKRFTDSSGLYLQVDANGKKRWFWKFYPDGKESRLALGSYPEVSLKAARLARDEAKRQRAGGVDPVAKRKAEKAAAKVDHDDTFAASARAFHAAKSPGWSPRYGERWLRMMERDMFPWIGSMHVGDVTAKVLLGCLNRVVKRGTLEVAHSLRQWSGQVFRYCIGIGTAERNPAADLVDALPSMKVEHVSAILDPKQFGGLLRDMDAYTGQLTTRVCMQLSALLFQRPRNMRAMEWAHLDFEAALWTIPSGDMKRTQAAKANGRPHFVPLAPQAIALLREIEPATGAGRFVFPALTDRQKHLSENTIRVALRRMGYTNEDHTAHGFRATARTLMVERLGVPDEVIEAQLAHGKSGPLGMAYDRAEFMEQRRAMMERWADYLDQLRAGAKVIQLRA